VAQLEKKGSRVKVSGPITMQTVTALLAEVASLPGGSDLEIDLAQVTDVDSSAVSMLFEWLRQAHNRNTSLMFANLPGTLLSLAALYGVDELIPHHTH